MFSVVFNMKLFIFLQESLLELLLSLYKLTDDPQLFLLAGKIILYYAENELVRAIYSHILLPCSYMLQAVAVIPKSSSSSAKGQSRRFTQNPRNLDSFLL